MALSGSANTSRAWLLAGGLMTLAACVPPPPDLAARDGGRLSAFHQARVGAISSWQLQGKVSILHDGKLWRAGLNWLHAEDSDRVNLTAFGGRTLMRLHNHPDGASAMDSRGKVYRGASFGELVAEMLGVDVPIENLRYWVVGMAAAGPGADATRFNQDGSTQVFHQDGWEVRYLQYRSVQHPLLKRVMMPVSLVLTRDDLKLTLVVQRWQLLQFKASVEEVV